jgi:tetratricopeptide (TPR) repeat protein
VKKKWNINHSLAGAAALATFLVYLAALHNDFVGWDDDHYVVENHHIRSFDAALFKWAFFAFSSSNWHPLTWISHALDYAIWGLNPLGHHLTNITLHAVNTFLVVVLAMRLLAAFKERAALNGSRSFLNDRAILIAAGTTGLLFGLHPLHVESVAWVAERKDLLCALFFLLSMMTYVRYSDDVSDKAHRAERTGSAPCAMRFAFCTNKHYLLSLGFFLLALLSKPMAITLPVVLLILDWHPFGRLRSWSSMRDLIIEKAPFLALSLASSVVTILAQRADGAIQSMEFASASTRLLVAAQSLVAYLRKMIWPLDLIPYYPYPKTASLLSPEYLSAIVLVIGLTAGCIVLVKNQKGLLTAWGYYIVTLLPVLGIMQVGNQAMADRYTYLPGLGPFLIMGLATAWTAEKIKTRGGMAIKITAAGAALGVVIVLCSATLQQIGIWKNTITLWNYVIEKEPDGAPQAYNNRGLAFKNMGRMREAISDFNKAVALNPAYALAFNNRGTTYKQMGMFNEAIRDYTAAIALNPDYFRAYSNRAIAYGKIGRVDKATEDFNKALALNPSYSETYLNRAEFYGEAGMLDKALENLDQALVRDPNYAEAYNNRGAVLEKMGQVEKALEDYNRAIDLDPSYYHAYNNKGTLYGKAGSFGEAIASFNKAIAVNPGLADAYFNRGVTFVFMRQYDSALQDFDRAIVLNPNDATFYAERGKLYKETGNDKLAVADFRKACDLGYENGCAALRESSRGPGHK